MSGTRPEPDTGAASDMRALIGRIATGPELSKDLAPEQARAGMRLILRGEVDPVQAAVFLIALRMKRETDDEYIGVLEALLEASSSAVAPVDEVAELADPYDGFARTLPVSTFLPALLAACGLPAVCHGVSVLGPKFGVTHRQVLQAAALPVDLDPRQAAAAVGDPRLGWAYVDQASFCPALAGLAGLRELIVKRPALSTVEGLLAPVRGRVATHLVIGYVHKAYPRIYALLARRAGFASALIVRGVEGGVLPALRERGSATAFHGADPERAIEFAPRDFGLDRPVIAPSNPHPLQRGADEVARPDTMAAHAAAQAGFDALRGAPGAARDALVCAAALCLWHLRRHDSLARAADAAAQALDSGAALARVERMRG